MLREQVIAFVEGGNSYRAAAWQFRVSIRTAPGMEILKRETGGLEPLRQGNGGGHGKLAAVRGWLASRMREKPDLALDDLVGELADRHGIAAHRISAWRALRRLGLTHEKSPAGR